MSGEAHGNARKQAISASLQMRAEHYHYRVGVNVPGRCMYCSGEQYGSSRLGAMHICAPCRKLRLKARAAAHKAVLSAVLAGEIQPANQLYCVDCGAFAALYDHRDYHQPLKVDPVCHRCNQVRGPGHWDPDKFERAVG